MAVLVLVGVSFLIGGASQRHALRLSLVVLATLPVLGLVALRAWDNKIWRTHGFALAILAAAAALPLMQLIPLPPAWWGALPGHGDGLLALDLAGLQPGWSPISVAPDLTWRSFLSFLPAVTVFTGVLVVGGTAQRGIVWLMLAALVVCFGLGLAQVMFGDAFYPWPTSDRGLISGLFANRNHLATFGLIVLPLAAALLGRAARLGPEARLSFWLSAAAIAVALVTIAATRSRAGVVLTAPALLLSALVAWTAAGRGRPGPALLGLAGAVSAALIVVLALGLDGILDRFDPAETRNARLDRWPTVAEAAQNYLPIGAGFGTFGRVYLTVETLEELDPTTLNRAHNEYLEAWLEGGWFSVGLLAAFLFWFQRRARKVWTAPPGWSADLARAATVGMLMVLAHITVEYPLRTVTIMVVFAALAAFVESASTGQAQERGARRRRRLTP